MASVVLGNNLGSGAVPVISGNPWSGFIEPIGGIQLRWSCPTASGGFVSGLNAYIYLSGTLSGGVLAPPVSGGPTITSGTGFSGGGALSGINDGMFLAPGDSYFIPKMAFRISGQYNLWAQCDALASGIGRLFFEIF